MRDLSENDRVIPSDLISIVSYTVNQSLSFWSLGRKLYAALFCFLDLASLRPKTVVEGIVNSSTGMNL